MDVSELLAKTLAQRHFCQWGQFKNSLMHFYWASRQPKGLSQTRRPPSGTVFWIVWGAGERGEPTLSAAYPNLSSPSLVILPVWLGLC